MKEERKDGRKGGVNKEQRKEHMKLNFSTILAKFRLP